MPRPSSIALAFVAILVAAGSAQAGPLLMAGGRGGSGAAWELASPAQAA
jgi:hypothetical protein